LVAQYLNKG